MERPDRLFAAAEAAGCVADLDWECRAAAVREALGAGLRSPARLFVNVEPRSFGTAVPDHLLDDLRSAEGRLEIIIEVTERALAADPAAMLASLVRARALGLGIAIDDVGASPASLALMPVIAPEVIKLDLRLVQQGGDADVSEIARAVMAQSEQTGALVVAEGVETAAHLDQARVLGAHLAQGWLFGRPGGLPPAPIDAVPFGPLAVAPSVAPTPFAALPTEAQVRVAPKRLLLPMRSHLEAAALSSLTPPVVVATFPDAGEFTSATAERYLQLARRGGLVLVVGPDTAFTPVIGVRSATIPTGHPLQREWVLAVLGPHEAVALVGRELSEPGQGDDGDVAYAVTHRRDVVIEVVRSTLQVDAAPKR